MNIKFPVSWLREYLKTDIAAKTIANYLTLSGPSVEKITKEKTDYIFDIEVTSNRPDAFSVFGIAREANAILENADEKTKLVPPRGQNLNLEPDTANRLILNVTITNEKLCPRFTAIILDNVKIKPSPAQIATRLRLSGIRPLNNIVDISNYLMLELGQPMHTFDFDKIKGAKMILRTSKEGEKITTLDGKLRKLPKGAIVIQDNERLIDLCGVMGGENSQITRRTKRVVLFVQAYDALMIRKTTQALAFRTEAAARFEKGIDPEGIIKALSRAVYLAKKITGAKIASELIDIYPQKQKTKEVTLSLRKLNDYLGAKIETTKASRILASLGFLHTVKNNEITAQTPSWRTQDIEGDVDLIEEVARINGYQKLPSTLPSGKTPERQESSLDEVIELKKALRFMGLTEIISYSVISGDLLSLSEASAKNVVEIANPLGKDWQFLRPTIIPSLLEVIAKNQNLEENLSCFEVARIYLKEKENLPRQDLMLSLATKGADFYKIKGMVENIVDILARPVELQKSNHEASPLFDSDLSLNLLANGMPIGTLGIIKNNISEHFGIEEQVAAAEINLTKVYAFQKKVKTYKPIPKYPAVIEDISAIFSKSSLVTEIMAKIKQTSTLIAKVDVIDIFEDEKIGRDKHSITLRLTYQKSSSTPTQEEVTKERNSIITILQKSFRAKIRK